MGEILLCKRVSGSDHYLPVYSERNKYSGCVAKIAFFLGATTFDTGAIKSSSFFILFERFWRLLMLN